ncbi:uncharacterized protein PRCAT00001423001 [Priceomyces carsonii]|uniref:uncharacterized protein n=1 Tax=Priceomyces carsonii TaxID=28549 RepID=UPI002EDAFD0D|nr:unnamed protein product [Priceomyces carsonii]
MESKERPYRSRKFRPCDSCRKRKSCCIIVGGPPCKTCQIRCNPCTFTESALRHKSRAKTNTDKAGENSNGTKVNKLTIQSPDNDKKGRKLAAELLVGSKANTISSKISLPLEHGINFNLSTSTHLWDYLFSDLEQGSIKSTIPAANESDFSCRDFKAKVSSFDFEDLTEKEIRLYNKGTLEGNESIRSQYIFENSCFDPYVYSIFDHDSEGEFVNLNMRTRQMDQSSNLGHFMIIKEYTGASLNTLKYKEEVFSLVGDSGPRMLLLFFKYVNPFLPVFSRSRFYRTLQNFKMFHTSLLSSMLNSAVDLWSFDVILNNRHPPNREKLFAIACNSIVEELHEPNYACLQGAILLSQKISLNVSDLNHSFNWGMIGLAYSVAQSLGINVNCLDWNLPRWEIRLRRRLWWSLYIQDVWFAVSYGRRPHFRKDDWDVPIVRASDFVSYSANEVDEESHDRSVRAFCLLANLSVIINDIAEDCFGLRNSRSDTVDCQRKVQTFLKKIENLELLYIDILEIDQKQFSWQTTGTASIAIAFLTSKVILLKLLLHDKHHDVLNKEHDLNFYFENGIDKSVTSRAINLASDIVTFIEKLRPVHLACFWYSWSRLNFATISNFFLLLYSAVKDEELDTIKHLLDSYRWILRHRAPVVDIMALGLSVLDSAYSMGLHHLRKSK